MSVATVKLANNCLLGRLNQIGEESSMAARRREQQKQKEFIMKNQEEADRAVRITGQELIKRVMFWAK